MINKVEQRFKEIMIMVELTHSKIPARTKEYIYDALKLAYMDGELAGMEKILEIRK